MAKPFTRALAALVLVIAIGAIAVVALRGDDSAPVTAGAAAGNGSTSSSADSVGRGDGGSEGGSASGDDVGDAGGGGGGSGQGTTEGAAAGGDADDVDAGGADVADPGPPPEVIREVPELVGNENWYNTEFTSIDEIYAANEVTIVQFWTFSCHNCKATLPYLQALYDDYSDAGLEIVGIHAPEFSFERDPERVQEEMASLGVVWPVTLDQTKRNFHDWQPGRTGYWPRLFIVDGDGNIRFDHIGEGKYDEMRLVVEQLLADA